MWAESVQGLEGLNAKKNEPGQAEDEEGLVELGSTLSIKCPLTQKEFEDPVTNTCGHSYEKSAVENYVRGATRKKCPVPGCGKQIEVENLQKDLVLIAHIRRLKNLKRKSQPADNGAYML